MSIQSSINAALGTIEMTMLRTGLLGKDQKKTPEGETPTTGEQPKAPEAPAQEQQPAPEPQAEPTPSASAADIITNGNMTAGAIASGRVQAKQMQIQKAKGTSADRLKELQQRKAAARKDIRKVKSEERQIRRQLEKEGGGE
jgi:hypothetical protein